MSSLLISEGKAISTPELDARREIPLFILPGCGKFLVLPAAYQFLTKKTGRKKSIKKNK